jgi:hypothetical protein
VVFKSAGRPGNALKSVEVWTNDPENRMTILSLRGRVVQQ